jgi:hypothetical protein
MKTKTAYYITAKKRIEEKVYSNGEPCIRVIYDDCSQYLLPNELHLIKTMLNNGIEITGVRKDKLTIEEYKVLFG